MNFGDWYFTQSQYNKLISFIRIEEILLLLMSIISFILIITFTRKKKTNGLPEIYKFLAISIFSEYIFCYVENRIFKRGLDLSPFMPGKEYAYHLDRFLLTALCYTILCNVIFVIYFLYILLKLIKNNEDLKIEKI